MSYTVIGMQPRIWVVYVHTKDLHMNVHGSNIPKRGESKCPSTDKGIKCDIVIPENAAI